MKAVILAAGRGARMGMLTDEVPKPMLRVGGRPILEWILEGLKGAGILDVCVVTGWRAEVIEDAFGEGSRLGMRLCYARQERAEGTGRAPEPARAFVGDSPFLLSYGDILVPPHVYVDMLRRWASGSFDGLVTVTAGQDITLGGLLFFDREFCLADLVEKPSAADLERFRVAGRLREGEPVWYNAGIYVFKPVLYEFTARLEPSIRGEYELTDALLAMVRSGHKVAGLEIAGRWVDVRDPEVLASLQSGRPTGGGAGEEPGDGPDR